MKDLIEILTWCRGANTVTEQLFVDTHIATLPNAWADNFGNWHLTIGANPRVLWSCHTDTVTRKEGRQNVRWSTGGILMLNNGKPGQCLGADDGAGLWLMLEMIKAKKEGHYVFHREEEIGGNGSHWISKNPWVLPETIEAAIAMDRSDNTDIITHQGFQRCCSDEFARSLMPMLPEGMRADDTGVFTDTANYVDLIGECTNLSVGYQRNHGPAETLDTVFLRELRDKLLDFDPSKMEIVRKDGEMEYGGYSGYGGFHGHTFSGHDDDIFWRSENNDIDADEYPQLTPIFENKDIMDFTEMVECAPDIAARLLEDCGVTRQEFRAHVFAIKGRLLGEG